VTKRQLYLLPAYPALALLSGAWLARLGSTEEGAPSLRVARVWAGVTALGLVVVALATALLLAATDTIVARSDFTGQEVEVAHALFWPLVSTMVCSLAVALWICLAWRRRDVRSATLRIGAGYMMLYAVLLGAVLPAFGPTKTYRPQSFWIRDRIGTETHFGMVYPEYAYLKMGAFGYHSGALTVRMERQDEVNRFFQDYPDSVVLIHEGSVPTIFAGDEASWRARVERELRTGIHLYLVVGGPLE
jgi:hypothetical protein